jgi:hypothetical protein
VVASVCGVAAASFLMDAMLSGLRSDWPDAKVRRKLLLCGVAVVMPVADTGGGAGGGDPDGTATGAMGAMVAVSGTRSGMAGIGAAGGVAAGAVAAVAAGAVLGATAVAACDGTGVAVPDVGAITVGRGATRFISTVV